MFPCPSGSTLFPYTTLFRSRRPPQEIAAAHRGQSSADRDVGRRRRHDGRVVVRRHLADRKSTRLNSSHLVISYAVFCLKKKTPSTTTPDRHGTSVSTHNNSA